MQIRRALSSFNPLIALTAQKVRDDASDMRTRTLINEDSGRDSAYYLEFRSFLVAAHSHSVNLEDRERPVFCARV